MQSCSVPQDLQQWHKLNSDLTGVMAWLDTVMPELEKLQTLEPKITIRDMESNIHKLKVLTYRDIWRVIESDTNKANKTMHLRECIFIYNLYVYIYIH